MIYRRCLRFVVSTFACLFGLGCGGQAHYEKVGGKWAWVGTNVNGRNESILDVDTASFTVLDDPRYAKDRQKVFFRGWHILDAQPASFEILAYEVGVSGRLYSKDSQHVFLERHTIVGADPFSFEVIDAPYVRDSRRAYCGTLPIEGSDPKTFQLVRDGGSWSETANKEFFLQQHGDGFADFKISPERPARSSSGRWAKDAKRIYHDATPVEGVDYETFQPIDEWRAKDKNREYYGWRTKEDWDQFRQRQADVWKQKAMARDDVKEANGNQAP